MTPPRRGQWIRQPTIVDVYGHPNCFSLHTHLNRLWRVELQPPQKVYAKPLPRALPARLPPAHPASGPHKPFWPCHLVFVDNDGKPVATHDRVVSAAGITRRYPGHTGRSFSITLAGADGKPVATSDSV